MRTPTTDISRNPLRLAALLPGLSVMPVAAANRVAEPAGEVSLLWGADQ